MKLPRYSLMSLMFVLTIISIYLGFIYGLDLELWPIMFIVLCAAIMVSLCECALTATASIGQRFVAFSLKQLCRLRRLNR